jgi:A/G-specific adenine glycosylase
VRDPYHIWVSEIMLQQTQVAAVVPYYQRFVQAFPTLATLAAASESEVLRLWEGLGYYRRARALHQAARLAVAAHGGRVPDDPEILGTFPGIGRYTLGAILSQAYDRRLPIIEANSARVLSRWFACQDDLRVGPTRRWLWETAERLLPTRRVGEFNQSIMELGALVCTPRKPACLLCPVADSCAARARGLQDDIPRKPKPAKATPMQEVAVVIERGNQVLLVQRPNDASRWASFWEFPHGPWHEHETARQAAQRLVKELTGLRVRLGGELTTVRHGITRFVITMVCLQAAYRGGQFQSKFYQHAKWVHRDRLPGYPLSVPQRRLTKALVSAGPEKEVKPARR